MNITCRSLAAWPVKPTPPSGRRRSQFQATWSKTVDLLEKELGLLNARNVVIEADCETSEIRIDGHLRANAKLRGPGVVVSFDSAKGALRFPCDTFTDWQANVRGIALALEALRAVDRYGVTQQAEQYRGWTALPDLREGRSPDTRNARVNAAMWLEHLCNWHRVYSRPTTDQLLNDPEKRRYVRKELSVLLHPDRNNGNDTQFKEMVKQFEALEGQAAND